MKEIEGTEKTKYLPRLRKILMFQYLNDSALEKILKLSTILVCQEEERIITEGDTSPFFFAMLDGCVNILVSEDEDKEVFISTIGVGECFGEAGIFLSAKRTANVVSADRAVILRIHRRDLLDFIKMEPASGIKMLMIIIYGLLRKLRSANQELAFERKSDIDQDDIDSVVEELLQADS